VRQNVLLVCLRINRWNKQLKLRCGERTTLMTIHSPAPSSGVTFLRHFRLSPRDNVGLSSSGMLSGYRRFEMILLGLFDPLDRTDRFSRKFGNQFQT